LAHVSEEQLRTLWAGLGYYARARNLREGARFILEKYGDKAMPTTFAQWLEVPGCGPYTAAAIASICFKEPVAAIDGNVIRVASRLLALKDEAWQKEGQQKLASYVHGHIQNSFEEPGDFNEALMDLGATVCRKQNPQCAICPLTSFCLAYKKNITAECPSIKPRRQAVLQDICALVLYDQQKEKYLVLERKQGFLSKTVGFPLFAENLDTYYPHLEKVFHKAGCRIQKQSQSFKHTITHHKITGHVLIAQGDSQTMQQKEVRALWQKNSNLTWCSQKELSQALSSSLDRKVFAILNKVNFP
jgi:A/G-specific adenine glycosylase